MIGNLTPPQRPSGKPDEQVQQMFTYLYQFVERLNYQLTQIDSQTTQTDVSLNTIKQQLNLIQNKIGQFESDTE